VSNHGFEDQFSTSHIHDLRPRWGKYLPNDSGVSRWQVTINLSVTAPINLDIGVVYYLYLFGRSSAGTASGKRPICLWHLCLTERCL
jgi:hypothetical protein